MKNLITLLLCLTISSAYAQDQNLLLKEAYALAEEEQLNEALSKFDEAFKLVQGEAVNYFDAACIAAELKNESKAYSLLQRSADAGWSKLEYSQRKKELRPLHDDSRWSDFTTKVKANIVEIE